MRLPFVASVGLTLCEISAAVDFANNINISICNWQQLRANVIRDTIYLDGGSAWYQYGESNGESGPTVNDGNEEGLLYSLNLGLAFGKTTNLTGLLQSTPKAGSSASNNIAPNYKDGVMFANDDEFILYGGLALWVEGQEAQLENQILGYEAYQWGPYRESWKPGVLQKILPNGVTRYVTNGAGVSAPSENLGFYFSGMRAEDWGLIVDGGPSNITANITANTLITVDMSTMGEETWKNDTLPDSIPGRANAELIWIPVAESGVLVAIGGVINPESLTTSGTLTEAQAAASNRTSPTFMETLPVYDIENKKWYMQNTTGDFPPQLTSFCSVVTAAADGSSYNVYIYGGYNGIDAEDVPSDDVYVLSIPSFTWIKVYSGEHAHGRSGHKCVKVYPDQMFVLGGIFAGDYTKCLDGGLIQVFNLNTLRFQESYNPKEWDQYQVPSLVTAQIGGDANGSATKTAPLSWNDDGLATVFSSKYTKTISTYYPYPVVTNSSVPSATPTTVPDPPNHHHSLPSWVGPVLGVVLGLIVIAALVIGWLMYRRHQYKKSYESGDSDPGNNRVRIFDWMYGTHMHLPKSVATVPSEVEATEKHTSGGGLSDATGNVLAVSPHSTEAGSFPVHELDATPSGRFELATEYNSPASYSSTPRTDHRPSLDGVLMGAQQEARSPIEFSEVSERDSGASRTGHQHQISDLSSALSDISEAQTDDLVRARYLSDISDDVVSPQVVSPEEQTPDPIENTETRT